MHNGLTPFPWECQMKKSGFRENTISKSANNATQFGILVYNYFREYLMHNGLTQFLWVSDEEIKFENSKIQFQKVLRMQHNLVYNYVREYLCCRIEMNFGLSESTILMFVSHYNIILFKFSVIFLNFSQAITYVFILKQL